MDHSPSPDKIKITLSDIPSDVWFFLIDQTEINTNFEDIQKSMLDFGIDNDNTKQLIKEMPDFISKKLEDITTQLSIGFFLGLAGLALKLLPIDQDRNPAFLIVAYGLIITGIFKTIRMTLQKMKFKRILKNLDNQLEDL